MTPSQDVKLAIGVGLGAFAGMVGAALLLGKKRGSAAGAVVATLAGAMAGGVIGANSGA